MTANLLSRLQGLTAPDREVGREVLLAFGWRKTCVGHFYGPLYHWSPPGGGTGFRDDDFYRHDPTASLDAAVALCERVLPGWYWRVGRTSLFPNGWAYISRTHPSHCDKEDEASCSDGRAATPAIALLIAILTAMEAKENG